MGKEALYLYVVPAATGQSTFFALQASGLSNGNGMWAPKMIPCATVVTELEAISIAK